MTDKEKLQKLFDAALKSPSDPNGGPLKRAFPTPVLEAAPIPAAPAPAAFADTVAASPRTGGSPAGVNEPNGAIGASAPTMAAVLDDAASTELATLLDEQLRRKSRKRRMEALVAAVVLLGLTGGGSAWFVHSPVRVQALTEVMRDIRSVGDVKSMVAKYRAALDRVAARGQQIDQATAAMGVEKNAADEKDPYMEAEMSTMMGGESKTVGQRNQALQASFGNMAKDAGGVPKATVALKEDESFDWQQ